MSETGRPDKPDRPARPQFLPPEEPPPPPPPPVQTPAGPSGRSIAVVAVAAIVALGGVGTLVYQSGRGEPPTPVLPSPHSSPASRPALSGECTNTPAREVGVFDNGSQGAGTDVSGGPLGNPVVP